MCLRVREEAVRSAELDLQETDWESPDVGMEPVLRSSARAVHALKH